MLNLSIGSCKQPSSGDTETRTSFRRELHPNDTDLVEQLVAEAGVFNAQETAMSRGLVNEALGSSDGAGYYFLFADGTDGLRGYTCFGPIPATDRGYELYWFVTAAPAKWHGLARALLETIEADICARGETYLFAETSTRADYAPAHALYVSLGYTHFCNVPDYHGDGEGLAIFGKRL